MHCAVVSGDGNDAKVSARRPFVDGQAVFIELCGELTCRRRR